MAAFRFHPLTPERWGDFERLFGLRGACDGCWCTFWRQSRADYGKNRGASNRALLRRLVEGGACPGILAYDGSAPVGWVAVEPRDAYPSLDRSRTLKRVDDTPVWSLTCFFIAREVRGQGLMEALIAAAERHARRAGATMLEAYPVRAEGGRVDNITAYTGIESAFRRAGFTAVARGGKRRVIMRRALR